jgi:hypothetical protein
MKLGFIKAVHEKHRNVQTHYTQVTHRYVQHLTRIAILKKYILLLFWVRQHGIIIFYALKKYESIQKVQHSKIENVAGSV